MNTAVVAPPVSVGIWPKQLLIGQGSLAKLGSLLETHKHSIDDILKEAVEHEREGLAEYHNLLEAVAGRNVMLEEYARLQIAAEELHLSEIDKMMRRS